MAYGRMIIGTMTKIRPHPLTGLQIMTEIKQNLDGPARAFYYDQENEILLKDVLRKPSFLLNFYPQFGL